MSTWADNISGSVGTWRACKRSAGGLLGVLLDLFGVFSGATAAVGDKNFGSPPAGCAEKISALPKKPR